ncbi:MAG: hypothetical protein PHV08_08325 [Sulfurovaceae bacterium]|jgi:uncharacterized tellurite resistance protein B-like protein|nr:hypothetical protein [Sulfurovaceae bacterium]
METKIKQSVAVLLAHIIKKDKRDVAKEAPLFCSLLGADFGCSEEEATFLLKNTLEGDYDLEEHLDIINHACCNDKLSKMHLLEQFNHIIYSDEITPQDYKEFEYIKNRLFSCEV